MKVLYLSAATGADYLCDMTFHGMRTLLGPDCVDVNKLTFMYQGANPPFHSIYALLPDIEVDRDDISGKLQARYFDLVIYGSVQRFREHFVGVHQLYPPSRIVYIDGEDDQSVVDCVGSGLYFKRELTDQHHPSLLPIEFSIPREKVRLGDHVKLRQMSTLIPGDYSTYVYYGPDGEQRYYDQYSESYFAHTRRKGGWDACRHYEIMAAGCLPYFDDLESCPSRTLHWLPKQDLLAARHLCDNWHMQGAVEWEALMQRVRETLLTRLTTEEMAQYVLDTVLST